MNFSVLSDTLDNVKNTKGLSEKTKVLREFFKTLRDEKHELFPILRLVVPKLDRDRQSYRIKESKISKLLIKMLGLPQGSDQNLLSKAVLGTSVDFGDVVYSVLKKYIVNKETGLTIQNLNTYLDKIANRSSDSGLDDQMLEIFRKLSPRNIRWLIQIILKDLKLGVSDNSILNSFHEDGANFYASNNNLKKLCEVLSNPQIKLHELEINMFEAFRPMLSKRCDANNFKKCFPDSKIFFIENKFDGERFQIHMENGKFKYFSRNGYDFTDSYGSSFTEGSFTPLLKNVFDPETKRVILDGEMMLWNKNTQHFGSKGMNLDVKKLGDKKKYQPCFCVFDILLHNDKVLTNQPLYKRMQVLKNVIKNPIGGIIVVSESKEARSRMDIINSLNLSVDNNEEGLVVKDPKSVYKCSDRKSGWFKIKMEYFDDVVHDLDVLMMGGSFGANNKINSFFIGVSSGVDTYFSFGRISSGLTIEQLDLLNDKLKSLGVDFSSFSSKSQGKLFFGRETPDIYIEPQHSCILQIRATELIRTTSDGVKCPYTLRFPRVLCIREDKPVDECLSMNELLELTQQNKSVIKLNKRHIELGEITAKTKPAKRIKVEVVNLKQAVEEGDFLNGKRFYVDSGTQKWAIEDIYFSIKKAGGDIFYSLESDIDIVVTSRISQKLSVLLKQANNFDVVHVDWLKRVLEEKRLLNYNQNEIIYIGNNYRKDISLNVDTFGDSFTDEIDQDTLKSIFGRMSQNGDFLNTNGATSFENKNQLFSSYIAYFDRFKEINDESSDQIYYSLPDELEFQYYKGTISKRITEDVNLIIMKENCDIRKNLICIYLENIGLRGIEIVTKDFLKNRISSQM